MKMDIEYELLNVRQDLKDSLTFILSNDVIDLNLYRIVYTQWYACNKMLSYYRLARKKAV